MSKYIYAFFCIVGTVLPLSQFVPWVLSNGLAITLFFQELFETRIGGFFGFDVIVSACVLFAFMYIESTKRKVPFVWTAVIGTCLVGVSLGLPLYLLLRQRVIDQLDASQVMDKA